MNRNPWTGISDWQEFRYDMRHPVLWHRRTMDNLCGRTDIPDLHRFIFAGLILEGLILLPLGLVIQITH